MTVQRPGCFSAPSIFSFTSRVCNACPEFAPCQKGAESRLGALPDSPAVRTILAQHEGYRRSQAGLQPLPEVKGRAPLSEAQESLAASLPKKAGDYLRKLFARGLDVQIREGAMTGVNPFRMNGQRPYHVAFEMLMRGSITKPALRAAYIEELGWGNAAAGPQVSLVWSLFPALGIADHDGCRLVPSPMMGGQNSVNRNQG